MKSKRNERRGLPPTLESPCHHRDRGYVAEARQVCTKKYLEGAAF